MNRHTFAIAITSVLLSFAIRCERETTSPMLTNIDYRHEMRTFVIKLSASAKAHNEHFIIIPQNGQELLTDNGTADGSLQIDYLSAIDATGREDLFYGYDNDDQKTPARKRQPLLDLCLLCEQHGIDVLVTDYCSTPNHVDSSYRFNNRYGFISFAAHERELNEIPGYPVQPYRENSEDIEHVSRARNFLYLINSEKYSIKDDFIHAVSQTNYDMVIMDLYHNETAYTASDIERLKTKRNGGKRLILCYMSIGEAEDYRFYWEKRWRTDPPEWLEPENPDWQGNFKVRYWHKEWQSIIYSARSSYLTKILNAGFDGAYLDLVDAFEYFESAGS